MVLRVRLICLLVAACGLIGGAAFADPQVRHVPIIVDGVTASETALLVEGHVYVPLTLAQDLQGRSIEFDKSKAQVVVRPVRPPSSPAKPVLDVAIGDSGLRRLVESLGLIYRTSPTLPNTLEEYSCIILENESAASPKTAERLKRYVAAGGGLVMWGDTPRRLAHEGGENPDLRTIADWFGSAYMGEIETYWGPWLMCAAAQHPMHTALRKDQVVFKYHGDERYPLLQQTDEFCEIPAKWLRESSGEQAQAAAMAHTYGKGCLYWQSVIYNANYPGLLELLRAGIARVTPRARYTPVEIESRESAADSSSETSKGDKSGGGLEEQAIRILRDHLPF